MPPICKLSPTDRPRRGGGAMSTPGVEPGLSRPRRDVLATRRCGPRGRGGPPPRRRRGQRSGFAPSTCTFLSINGSAIPEYMWPRGVTASTLDPESSNRGSNPRKASLHERSRLISRTLVASNLANYKARSTDLFSSPPLAQAADDRTVPSHWKGRGSILLCR